MKSINMDTFLKLNRIKKLNLIDIRSEQQYRQGTIDNAVNIEAYELINNPVKHLNFDDEYFIFCEYGYTSKNVAYVLTNYGYNIINITGGYHYYKQKR